MTKKRFTAAAAMMMVMGLCANASAAFDEHLNDYTLDTIVVEADAAKNKFGDTITEQSYYRTGGDVKVITREEIEKRHYTDLTEAIKRIPGVTFQNPGYRGGEYGYQFYNNGVSINGDTRVIILVDGRRVDNAASTRASDKSTTGTKSTGVNLDQVTNMENVDKIEVIKGPGASVYGADALGGVINIITRKGGQQNVGSIDLSTGSWHKHKYAISYSGSAGNDNSWHYFLSANRDMSGDTKYKDGIVGGTGTLGGSKWKEDGVNFRLDKDFNDKQNLKVWYNFKEGKDGYPIAVPNLKYWNEKDWNDIIFKATVGQLDENNKLVGGTLSGDAKNPGYHNLYALDGQVYGSFSKFKNNDWDIQYTFDKDNGMESFIRVYDQNHRYSHRDKYQWYVNGRGAADAYNAAFPNGATNEQLSQWIKDNLAPFPDGDQDRVKEWLEKTGGAAQEPTSWHEEKNRGVQLQYAKSVGVNDIIASITYDKAKNFSKRYDSYGKLTSSHVDRKTILGYVQDKIHISDKWDLTPAIRYSKYSSFETTNSAGTTQGKGDTNLITPVINTQYMFDDTSSMYFGWTKVFRPLKEGDYNTTDGVFKTPLDDEKGDAWTLGVRKDLTDKTSVAVHYDWTRMSSAIATLPIFDTSTGNITKTAVNAKEDKKSFNVTLDHQFDDHFTLSASYSHMKDEWKAKNGWVLDPSWGYANDSDINTAINSLRPKNHYSLNLSYENGKLYTGLLTNWYTGCSDYAFTNNRFLVLDWNINYEITKDMTVYALVTNLTNEAYETSYNSWNGVGSSAMPGRCWMVGVKYTF
ncbi:TonB-dependent receptor [uncultured Phascolarctobacterium sp.]|uniref:TonB-dependent receptor n=1 Tax=uncultured Phascolarctobacterium sp. TaxID=512296 RepID=UPI0025E59CFB|nr:TonB-dependent receptor [uncultured Phascolarctobacterium sp.]